LDIWNTSIELAKDMYRLTEKFPEQERYGLVSQMRRASVSIPSNVAEGFGRHHNKKYRQSSYLSLGRCAELETQLTIAKELKYIPGNEEIRLLEEPDHICRMISNLLKKL